MRDAFLEVCSYFSSEVEEVVADDVGNLFSIYFYFALVDGQSFEESASPVVDVFVGDNQLYRMDLCLRKVQLLVVSHLVRSKLLLNVQQTVSV